MIIYLALIIFIFLIIHSSLFYVKQNKLFKLNGPIPVPIIGNLILALFIKRNEFIPLLREFKNKYGDAFLVHLFYYPYIIISHPKHAEGLLSSTELIKKGKSYQYLEPWLGDGLLTSTGQKWKLHRKFLTPAFHFNILQNFLPVFIKNEKILINKLKGQVGKPVSLFPIIALNALDNVTESIMGVSVNAQLNSESEYVKSIETLSTILALKMRNPIIAMDLVFNLLPYKKKQDRALNIVHEQSTRVIEKRREELKHQNVSMGDISEFGIKNKHAFLDLLLLSEIDGHQIPNEQVREEVDTFMFEGHDTTTSGIVFALYCIAKRQDVQEKLFEEQKNIFGDDLTKDPQYSDLQQMKYLDMVIKESLRLFPSVPLIERSIVKETEIAGLKIAKNTSVIVNILEIQRHPDLYKDPLEFQPERFDLTNIDKSKTAFSWLAFSAGPRNCIGQKFAMMEMKVTIAAIIKNFELQPVDEKPILCADLILRSENATSVVFTKRNS